MTDEIYGKLVPWEETLKAAVDCSFVHLSGEQFGVLADIYEELFGEVLPPNKRRCNICRLNSVKRLGAEYFKERDRRAAVPEKQPSKRGRPRKLE